MDVVPPTGAVCARLGSQAQIADTATMPAVIAKQWPVKLDFDDISTPCPFDACRHSVGLADKLIQQILGEDR